LPLKRFNSFAAAVRPFIFRLLAQYGSANRKIFASSGAPLTTAADRAAVSIGAGAVAAVAAAAAVAVNFIFFLAIKKIWLVAQYARRQQMFVDLVTDVGIEIVSLVLRRFSRAHRNVRPSSPPG
jgi:hypothetical protein